MHWQGGWQEPEVGVPALAGTATPELCHWHKRLTTLNFHIFSLRVLMPAHPRHSVVVQPK